jgi:hypothetical protein
MLLDFQAKQVYCFLLSSRFHRQRLQLNVIFFVAIIAAFLFLNSLLRKFFQLSFEPRVVWLLFVVQVPLKAPEC